MPRTPTDAPTAWEQTQQNVNEPAPAVPARERRRRARPKDRSGFWLLAAAGLIMIVALGWYFAQRGGLGSKPSAPAVSAAASGGAKSLSTEQLKRGVEQMSERVKKDPNDSSAWAMLAHTQAMLGNFDDARKAYAKLVELLPKDAQVLADYADAVGVAQGRRLAGEPATLIARALALDPKNLKALALAGREAFERKNYAQAISFWERARAESTDAALSAEIDANIAEARAFDGRERPPEAQAKRPGGTTITGRVTLSPELQARVSPGDAVFIFARPLKGSRMPVALLRKKVSDLPLDFTLDDSQAMVPEMKLSMLATVAVGARISRRGDAVPQPGDLQGLVESVELGSKGVKVEIREVLK